MANSVRIGGARVDISGQDAEFQRVMRRAGAAFKRQEQQLQRTRRQASLLTRTFKGMLGPITALASVAGVASLARSISMASKEAANFGANLVESARSVGIATEQLYTLQRAFEADGVSADTTTKALHRLNRAISETRHSSTARRGFSLLGIDPDSVQGQDIEMVLKRVSDGLAGVADQATRAEAAATLFGRAGPQLLAFLSNGSVELDASVKHFRALGTITGEQGRALKDLAQTYQDNAERINNFTRALVAANADGIASFDTLATDAEIAWKSAADSALSHIGRVYEGLKQGDPLQAVQGGAGVLGGPLGFLGAGLGAAALTARAGRQFATRVAASNARLAESAASAEYRALVGAEQAQRVLAKAVASNNAEVAKLSQSIGQVTRSFGGLATTLAAAGVIVSFFDALADTIGQIRSDQAFALRQAQLRTALIGSGGRRAEIEADLRTLREQLATIDLGGYGAKWFQDLTGITARLRAEMLDIANQIRKLEGELSKLTTPLERTTQAFADMSSLSMMSAPYSGMLRQVRQMERAEAEEWFQTRADRRAFSVGIQDENMRRGLADWAKTSAQVTRDAEERLRIELQILAAQKAAAGQRLREQYASTFSAAGQRQYNAAIAGARAQNATPQQALRLGLQDERMRGALRDMAKENAEAAREVRKVWEGAARSVSDAMAQGFADMITSANSFRDVMGSVINAIIADFARLAITQPLSNALFSAISGGFGGFGGGIPLPGGGGIPQGGAGFGARGGMLVPGMPTIVGERGPERIIPLGGGQLVPGTGGAQVNFNGPLVGSINSSDGPGVRAALAQAAPSITQAAQEGVLRTLGRPGLGRRFAGLG